MLLSSLLTSITSFVSVNDIIDRIDELLFIDIVIGVIAVLWCIEQIITNPSTTNSTTVAANSYAELTLYTSVMILLIVSISFLIILAVRYIANNIYILILLLLLSF